MERTTATEGDLARAHSGMGSPLDRLAFSATLHCLTGCAIGEVTGMAIGMALGWSNLASIALAVGLAYLFGFSLTAIPLIKGGLAVGAVISTAVAADTVSITIMEAIDNLFVALVPGALDAGVGDPLLWGSVATGFAIAFPFAFIANRYMIARGTGVRSGASALVSRGSRSRRAAGVGRCPPNIGCYVDSRSRSPTGSGRRPRLLGRSVVSHLDLSVALGGGGRGGHLVLGRQLRVQDAHHAPTTLR